MKRRLLSITLFSNFNFVEVASHYIVFKFQFCRSSIGYRRDFGGFLLEDLYASLISTNSLWGGRAYSPPTQPRQALRDKPQIHRWVYGFCFTCIFSIHCFHDLLGQGFSHGLCQSCCRTFVSMFECRTVIGSAHKTLEGMILVDVLHPLSKWQVEILRQKTIIHHVHPPSHSAFLHARLWTYPTATTFHQTTIHQSMQIPGTYSK